MMKSHHHLMLLTLLTACVSAWTLTVHAQVAAPSRAASAPVTKPLDRSNPREMTPAEKSAQAQMPGDLRPEEPVVPQISVPLGRTPPAPVAPPRSAAQNKRLAATGIDDSIARCKALTSQSRRDACLERAGRPAEASSRRQP